MSDASTNANKTNPIFLSPSASSSPWMSQSGTGTTTTTMTGANENKSSATHMMNNSNILNTADIYASKHRLTNPLMSPFLNDTPDGGGTNTISLSKNRLSFGRALASPPLDTLGRMKSPSPSLFPSQAEREKDPPQADHDSLIFSPPMKFGQTSKTSTFPPPSLFSTSTHSKTGLPPNLVMESETHTDLGLRQRKGMVGTRGGDDKVIQGTTSTTYPPLPPKASLTTFTALSSTSTSTLSLSDTETLSKTKTKRIHNTTSTTSTTSNAITAETTESTTQHASKNDYSTWVIVYGIPTHDPMYYQSLISRFSSYGTILSRYPSTFDTATSSSTASTSPSPTASRMNWICLRYETELQAEKALCQHGSFFIPLSMMESSNSSAMGNNSPPGKTCHTIMFLGVMRMNSELALHVGLDCDKMWASSAVPLVLPQGSGKPWVGEGRTTMPMESRKMVPSLYSTEEDILFDPNDPIDEIHKNVNSTRTSRSYKGYYEREWEGHDSPKSDSICEKVFFWIFGWDSA